MISFFQAALHLFSSSLPFFYSTFYPCFCKRRKQNHHRNIKEPRPRRMCWLRDIQDFEKGSACMHVIAFSRRPPSRVHFPSSWSPSSLLLFLGSSLFSCRVVV